MSGGSLSQEEIDALMNASNAPDPAVPASVEATSAAANMAEQLTAIERDAIGEIGNICMSSAATALSGLLGRPVQITTPTVHVVDEAEIRAQFASPAVLVLIEYTDGIDGRNVLFLTIRDASVVADLMMGGEGVASDDIDELHASAVAEAMNQMMGSSATSMAEMLGRRVDISAPTVTIINLLNVGFAGDFGFEGPLVRTAFKLRVGDLLDTSLMQVMPVALARSLVDALTTVAPAAALAPAASAPAAPAPASPVQDAAAPAAPAPTPVAATPPPPALHSMPVPVAQSVTFPTLDEVPSAPGGSDISLLLDVPLQVTVELGRAQLRIRDVLDLVPGSIVELDKLAGGPVDVLVNGKQIARGEVVVIDEEFGVRITDVASQVKRLRGLSVESA